MIDESDNRLSFKQLRFTKNEYERLVKLAMKRGIVASEPPSALRRDRTKLSVEVMINAWAKAEMGE